MKLIDFRLEQDGPPRGASFVILGKESTLLYRWQDHNMVGAYRKRFATWEDFMTYIDDVIAGSSFPQLDSTAVWLDPNSQLVFDPWRDSYKWGRARSQYSPEVRPFIQEAMSRQLILLSTTVLMGNWSSGETYETLGTAQELLDTPSKPGIRVWHGTSSYRSPHILKDGLQCNKDGRAGRRKGKVGKPGHVYFSASRFRAGYFATETARLDTLARKKEAKETGKPFTGPATPVVLSTIIPPQLFAKLVADEDWIAVKAHEGTKESHDNWQESWTDFGQVGMRIDPTDSVAMLAP